MHDGAYSRSLVQGSSRSGNARQSDPCADRVTRNRAAVQSPVLDPDGQERSKSYPDKKLKDARAFLVKVETDKLTGDYVDSNAGKAMLREYCENWLKGQSQDESSQRTMRSKLEKQVYPFLGARSLSTIGAAIIRDWLSWMNGNNISESHKSQVFDLLSAVLSAAVDEKKIRINPCKAKGDR